MEPRATWRSVPAVVLGFRGRVAAAVVVALVGAVLTLVLATLPIGDAVSRASLGNATYLAPALCLALAALAMARRRSISRRERRGWTLLAIATILNLGSSIGWLLAGMTIGTTFDPTFFDLGYAAWSLLVVAGVWELRTEVPAPAAARRMLDVAVVVTAAVLVVLTTVIVPAGDRPGGVGANLAEAFLYPLCDIAMVAVVAAVLARPAPLAEATVFRLLGSGVLIYVAGDFLFSWRLMSGGSPNDGLAAGLGASGLAVIVVAVAVRLAQTARAEPAGSATGRAATPPQTVLTAPPTTALPYVAVLIAFALMLVAWIQTLDAAAQSMALAGYALVSFLLVRHKVAERDLARLAALEATEASEERFRFAFDRAPMGIIILRDDRVTYANDAVRALLQFPADGDLATMRWVDYIVPADRDRLEAIYAERRVNQSRKLHTRVALPSGAEFALELDAANILIGGEASLIVFVRDTTERDAAERSVRDSEERLRYVVEHAPFVTVFADVDGAFTWLAGDIASPTGGSMLGRRVTDVFPPEVADRFEVLRQRVVTTGQSVEAEMQVPGPWGRPIIAIEVQPRRDELGNMAGIVAYARDATQERERDAARVEAQRLEGIGLLAGGIAHDFNNLLVGILGNADYARSELPEGSHVRSTVDDIEHAARRAAELVRDLLAYSSGREAPMQPVDLSSLVAGLDRLLRTAISRHITLATDLAPALPPVMANATQVRQLVMNLVTNAGEAIGDQAGTITIRTRAVTLDAPVPPDGPAATSGGDEAPGVGIPGAPGPRPGVELVVADTGPGMDAATRDRIFLPFFTTKFTGRGLGMWVVAGVVRSLGGTIDVESEPGRGTGIGVRLPAAAGAAVAQVERETISPAAIGARKGARVLVVDDEPLVREVARRFLERGGYQVTLAEGGRAALAILADGAAAIDVVLLDVTMPELDGPATYRAMATTHAGLPVVLSSGHDGAQVQARFVAPPGALPPMGFVAKPYHAAELLASIEAALDGRAAPPA